MTRKGELPLRLAERASALPSAPLVPFLRAAVLQPDAAAWRETLRIELLSSFIRGGMDFRDAAKTNEAVQRLFVRQARRHLFCLQSSASCCRCMSPAMCACCAPFPPAARYCNFVSSLANPRPAPSLDVANK